MSHQAHEFLLCSSSSCMYGGFQCVYYCQWTNEMWKWSYKIILVKEAEVCT